MQAFASSRHGVVTRSELVSLGYSKAAVARLVTRGLVEPLRPRVFRVSAVEQSWLQQIYALCRWLEPNVVASHRTAAALWRLGDVGPGALEVTVDSARRRIQGVTLHRTDHMPLCDRRVKDLIPVTDPTRTVIDCCAVLSERAAEAVMDDACHARLTTPDRLLRRIDELSAPGRNGIALARELVERRIRNYEMPESRLTRKVLRLIRQGALPIPVSLHPVRLPNGITIHPDLAYAGFRVAIEADGWKDHGTPTGWQGDRHRDNPLQTLGWIVLRFTWEDVTNRPDYVIQTITDALRSRGAFL